MANEREQAAKAREKYTWNQYQDAEGESARAGYDLGYVDGHAAATAEGIPQADGWVAIETVEDLPKVNQPYLFTCPSRQGPFVKEVWFSEHERDMCIQFAGRFLAYRELPAPYQRKSEGYSK